MGQITFNVPDAVEQRVLDAVAVSRGWTPESGLTKLQFFRKVVREFVKGVVSEYEASAAARAAYATAKTSADQEVDIT